MAGLETRFSGTVPENYDHGLGPFIFEHYAKVMADRCASLGPAAVLETAAGTGIVTRQLRDTLASDCSLLARDLNRPMLDYAAGKFAKEDRVAFAAADAGSLPFEDDSFDVVVCQFGVMFFPDRDASYREVLRVLKPGGTYLFSVWDAWSANPFAQIAYDVGAEFFERDPPAFYKVPFGYCDVGAITHAAKAAGFADCSAKAVPHRQSLCDISRFARGIVYGNPLHDEILERGIAADAVHQRLCDVLRVKLGDEMPLNAIFLAATKA